MGSVDAQDPIRLSGLRVLNSRFPKTAERTSSRLPRLLLQPIQPLPHTCELFHLRLMMPPPEPIVGLPVHPPWLLGERHRHVRAPSETLPDRLGTAKSTGHLVLPLALVDQVVAMTAQEILPLPVEDRHPTSAPGSRTDEPRPLSSEVAHCPVKRDRLLHIFPLIAQTATVTKEYGDLLWSAVSTHHAPNGARFSTGPRPAQGEPASG